MTNQDIFTIQEVNTLIKSSLNETFDNTINIKGEIYNYRKAHNNIFASLRDKNSSINIVCFSKINININNGSQIIATGKIDYYTKNGNINFIASSIKKENDELGNLYKIYETTKTKYENKGYFTNKKQKPKSINNIGIITSCNGAALQDILYVLNNNNFNGNVYIKDCLVQGESCHKSIINALKYFNESTHNIDVLLVSRGGGSFDDLMGFSHEDVLEEIHKSKYFTISAIGHEIDFMLSDFVADLRAPTPSIAAEIICLNQKECLDKIKMLNDFSEILKEHIINKIKILELKIYNIQTKYENANPMNQIKNIYDNLINKIKINIIEKLNTNKTNLIKVQSELENNNIKKKIDEGYCILFNNNKMIKDIAQINKGDKYSLYINGVYREIYFT
jgi:exodeoxyribonuclease VII large subunit